jgi:hypothetical protein
LIWSAEVSTGAVRFIETARNEFRRAERGESEAWVHRLDGAVVWVPSFTREHRVPHDLAHAVTERELRMVHGVFGSIMAGAAAARYTLGGLSRKSGARLTGPDRVRRIVCASFCVRRVPRRHDGHSRRDDR